MHVRHLIASVLLASASFNSFAQDQATFDKLRSMPGAALLRDYQVYSAGFGTDIALLFVLQGGPSSPGSRSPGKA